MVIIEHKVVDRAELFEKPIPKDIEEADLLPNLNVEFVEVDRRDDEHEPQNENDVIRQVDEEYEFPLFSFGISEPPNETHVKSDSEEHEARGRSALKLMKVSLREPSPDVIKNERPKSYYYSDYSLEEKAKFSISAIDADTILCHVNLRPFEGWPHLRGKVLDVKQHNINVEQELSRMIKSKRRRPSKKQRVARKLALEREAERNQKDLEIKKLIKKKFHKRGGKKNKKATSTSLANPKIGSKPKFRTE